MGRKQATTSGQLIECCFLEQWNDDGNDDDDDDVDVVDDDDDDDECCHVSWTRLIWK